MTRAWRTLSGIAALSAVAGCAEREAGLTPAREAAIRDSVAGAMESFWRLSAAGEWDSVAALYSTDPGFRFAESGRIAYGSAAEVRAALAGIPAGTTITTTHERLDIDPVAPGAAVVTAPFETVLRDTGGGGFTYGGALTIVWVHDSEGWRIRAGHSSGPVPRREPGTE